MLDLWLATAPKGIHWHNNLRRVWCEEKELLVEEVEQWHLEWTKRIVEDVGILRRC